MNRLPATRSPFATGLRRVFQGGMAYAWLTCALVLAFTLASWRYAADSVDRDARQRFEFEAQELDEKVRARMTGYEQLLRSASAFFTASHGVERSELKRFVQQLHLDRHLPGVRAINFARAVPLREREAHVGAVRADGLPDYRIHPGGDRTEYLPIVYVEPLTPLNRRVLGYDLLADSVRRAAVERARDTGEPALTARVNLQGTADAQTGCLLYVPVYRTGAPQSTPAERRAATVGYVFAAFQMKELVHGVLGAHRSRIDLEIYDGTEASPASLMHDDVRHGDKPARFVRDARIEVGGRTWTLRQSSTPAFEADADSAYPWLVAASGIIVSVLLFLLVRAMVAAREKDLRFRSIVGSALDAIVIIDGDGKVVEFNPSATRLFGRRGDQALGRDLAKLIIPAAHREAHRKGLARLRETGTSQFLERMLEMSALRADGSEFPVELVVVPVRDVEPPLFAGFVRDISGRKRTGEALRESQARLQHLLTLSPAMIYAVKPQGPVTFISENVREHLGYEPAELLGDADFWPRHLHPDDRTRMLALKSRLPEDGHGSAEYRFRHKDGTWRWMHDVTVLIRDATGAPQELIGAWLDITERRRTEDALREAEARNAAVIASALDAIVVNDGDGRIVEFNPAAERIFGWTRGQALGQCVDELLIPDSDGGQWRRDFRKSLETGAVGFSGRRAEVRSLHADGHEFPTEIALQRIDRNGRLYFIAFVRDITEQKRAQEALQASEARLRQLLATTPAVIWAGRAEGDYGATFVSENVRAQLGYAPQDFTGDSGFWASHIHPEDRERIFADLPELIAHGRIAHQYRFQHADGSWRWMHDEASVVRDAEGRLEQIVGTWIDITARVEAEQALARARERLRFAVEGSGVALWDADAATGEVYLSERWAEMLGASKGETHTTVKELLKVTHPEERQRLLAAALLVAKGERDFYREEHRVRTVSGEWRWVLSQGKVTERLPDGRARRMSGTNLDITERRRAQAALEETLRMQSEFMNNVTHELRSPLNSVIGFAELLKEGVPGPLNEKQAAFIADVHAGGLQLLKLVEGVLEMSRLGAAGFALAPEPLEVGAALAECLAAHRQAAQAERVSIALEVAPDIGLVRLDPRALRRILDALCDNAIKFNCDGGSVTVRARRAGGALEIAVADTGIGLAPEDRAKLFQPLVQLDASLARRRGGIGLGLALARRLAELQGGTIEAESEPGRGSTFTLRLPVGEGA